MANLVDTYYSEQSIQPFLDDANIAQWLLHVKAFTPRLKQYIHSLRLEVLSQEDAPLYQDELALLENSHTRENALIRTVLIYGDEKLMCYARVSISDSILEKQFKDFDELKERPLGETLFFNSPDAFRDRFQYFQLESAQNFMIDLPAKYRELFYTCGRNSVFNNNNGEVLVTEIFSKHIPDISKR